MASPVLQAEVRPLGQTEANWCAAAESGTGISIASILFDRRVPLTDLKQALTSLLSLHPRLRSVIFLENKEFVFRTPEEAYVRLTESDTEDDSWDSITEKELNTSFAKDYPVAVFQPKLYRLKNGSSLLLLRVHAAAADMASLGTILRHVVSFLGKKEEPRVSEPGVDLVSLEDGILPGQADKPFWAHGMDVVGYGLSSRRHAYLPFEDTKSDRVSKLIRAALTADATTSLLKECEKRGVSVHGVVNAAALKAIAAYKQVGAKGEHYGSVVLLQCRSRLQPPLPDFAIGFYYSAMMRTIHTTEPEPFWDVAKRCSEDMSEAVKNRKHFRHGGLVCAHGASNAVSQPNSQWHHAHGSHLHHC